MGRKQGDKAAWNGSECILWPIEGMTRKQAITQSFILDRVARFTRTQRAWLIHWLRNVATSARNIEVTAKSLVAMAECIERCPFKSGPEYVVRIVEGRTKPRYLGKDKEPVRARVAAIFHTKGCAKAVARALGYKDGGYEIVRRWW